MPSSISGICSKFEIAMLLLPELRRRHEPFVFYGQRPWIRIIKVKIDGTWIDVRPNAVTSCKQN